MHNLGNLNLKKNRQNSMLTPYPFYHFGETYQTFPKKLIAAAPVYKRSFVYSRFVNVELIFGVTATDSCSRQPSKCQLSKTAKWISKYLSRCAAATLLVFFTALWHCEKKLLDIYSLGLKL
jgi:hypothetical protein